MFKLIHQSIDFKTRIFNKNGSKQYGIPFCTQSLDAPCSYFKYWPIDMCSSLELKHVASYVLLTIYCVVFD
jgi:hypothetical protein